MTLSAKPRPCAVPSNAPSKAAHWHPVVWAGPLAAVLMLWIVPWFPTVPSDSLDSGWALALSIACERHFAFGSSLLFTYGPLGCLTTWQYWPALYGPAMVLWSMIALLSIMLLVEMQSTPGQRVTIAVALAWLGVAPDTALLVLPVMVVLHAASTRRATATGWLAVAVLAAIALTKFTLFPLCLASVFAAALLRHPGQLRSIALETGFFSAALLLIWVLTRQQLADFPSWLRGAAEISAAYPQAMAFPDGSGPSASRVDQILPYGIPLAAVAVLTTADLRFRSPTGRALRLPLVAWAFVAAVLFIVVRHATVRADGHMLVGYDGVGALALLIAAHRLRGRFALWTVAAACAFVYMLLLWPERYHLYERTQTK